MIAILEKSSVRERAARFNRQAYHWMGKHGFLSEKTELLEGVIVEKMPKSKLHVLIVSEIYRLLALQLPEHLRVLQEQPLALGESEPEPDIAIVDTMALEDKTDHPSSAHMVIEVSSSSLALDRDKSEIYAQAGIPRYRIINTNDRMIEEYTDPLPSGYARRAELEYQSIELWPGIHFPISRY